MMRRAPVGGDENIPAQELCLIHKSGIVIRDGGGTSRILAWCSSRAAVARNWIAGALAR
jgi:hypothetical protein